MEHGAMDFEQWYEAEHPRLLRALRIAARSPDLARECTDEAFARAYARWPRVSSMANPAAWTYRVAVNVLRRRLRRQAMERAILLRTQGPSVADAPVPDVDLWAAVERLPPRQRLAIGLRYVAGFTEAQVAEAMGIRPGTVAATLSNARARLLRELETTTEVTAWQT